MIIRKNKIHPYHFGLDGFLFASRPFIIRISGSGNICLCTFYIMPIYIPGKQTILNRPLSRTSLISNRLLKQDLSKYCLKLQFVFISAMWASINIMSLVFISVWLMSCYCTSYNIYISMPTIKLRTTISMSLSFW